MDDSKWIATSKTFIGLVILAFGPWLAKHAITSDDLQSVATYVIQGAGLVLGIYGRMKADKPVTILPKP